MIVRKNSDKKLNKSSTEDPNQSPPLKYSVQWLRVHLLLKLIVVLEKLMNSAIHGGSSVFNLTEIPVVCLIFLSRNIVYFSPLANFSQ